MRGLLYDIYSGDYDVTPKRDKRQREELLNFLYFQNGFRLGVRLMAEALTSATG